MNEWLGDRVNVEVPLTCPRCERAKLEKSLGGPYQFGCDRCKARGVARLSTAREAWAVGYQTRQYQALLADQRVKHEDVKAWLDLCAAR